MRSLLITALVLVSSLAASGQPANGPTEVEQVREAASVLFPKREKAMVLLHDLTHVHGRVVFVGPDSFHLGAKKKSKFGIVVHFADVLAITSKKRSISFIPDPQTPGYGKWTDVTKLTPNTLIEVTNTKGEVISGRYRTGGPDHFVLAHKEKNDERTVKREDVAYVHRVRYGFRDISGGLSSGAGTGQKVGRQVGKAAGQIRGPISGQPMGNGRGMGGAGLGTAIGAVIGVLIAAANKSESFRVLLYSP